MAEQKPLYSTCVAVLGFICLIIGATAVFIPVWGYFDAANGSTDDNGYFGPWKICKVLLYNRERCGTNISKFRPKGTVWVAGLLASFSVAVLGVFCVLSVLQLAMISSKERVVIKYSFAVVSKVVMALIATMLAIASAGLFALQTDDRSSSGYQISRGPSFYIIILLIILDSVLFGMSIYDMLFARRTGGDPTRVNMPAQATTYGNPGFRERTANGGGISMTDASGKPYTAASNGSMVSMNTTSTTLGSTNGSTLGSSITRSPLRSSLKKPRPKQEGGLGIQNPGFSGTSPTMGRNGSMKKVRIQTQSTEV